MSDFCKVQKSNSDFMYIFVCSLKCYFTFLFIHSILNIIFSMVLFSDTKSKLLLKHVYSCITKCLMWLFISLKRSFFRLFSHYVSILFGKFKFIFKTKNSFIFNLFFIQVSLVGRRFYPFHICYFYFIYHFYRHEIIKHFTDMLDFFSNVLFVQHSLLYCHKLACISYYLPKFLSRSLQLALWVIFF